VELENIILDRFRKPMAAYFLSDVECRPNINKNNIMYVYIELHLEHVSKSGTGLEGQGGKKRRKER
jgi:hypothetical protein